MTSLSPAERAAVLDDAGAILDRACDAFSVPRFDGHARASAVDELARRLVLDREASSGPIVFEGRLRDLRFEFLACSSAAHALAALDDPRLARALEAVRAWSATEGRAIVHEVDPSRVLPTGYVTPAEVRARFADALRAEFPDRVVECRASAGNR